MSGIVHCQIVGGDQEDIKNLSMALNTLKQNAELDMEFIITNENVKIRDVKYLLDELINLYKQMKKLKEQSVEKKNE